MNVRQTRIGFTISIGASELRKGDSLDALIARADRALYKARHTGNNRAISEKEA